MKIFILALPLLSAVLAAPVAEAAPDAAPAPVAGFEADGNLETRAIAKPDDACFGNDGEDTSKLVGSGGIGIHKCFTTEGHYPYYWAKGQGFAFTQDGFGKAIWAHCGGTASERVCIEDKWRRYNMQKGH